MRAIRRALVVACVSGAACSDPAGPPPLPVFSISPPTQWSGGPILIRSRYLVGRYPLPMFFADSQLFPLTRIDDSTVISALPLGPSGPVTVLLVRDSLQDTIAVVQRVGLRQKGALPVALDGELHATDSAGVPLVFGGYVNGTQNREQIVRVRVTIPTFEVLTLREPSNAFYGMAPSAAPGIYAVRDSTDSLRLAMLFGSTPAVTSTVPWVGTGFSRQVSQLSPGIWLFTNAHQSYTRAEADTCCVYRAFLNAESPWAVYLSPRGDRTTLATIVAGTPGDDGVPVFDNATGAVAYRLPLRGTEAATFSADGSVLFAAGGSETVSDTLVAVDATLGNPLVPKVPLPAGLNALGVAYRSGGGGQLLVAAADASTLALLVYDASTLTLLGFLPTGDGCGPYPQTGPCFMGVVTVDEAHQAAYIMIPGSPAPLWTFDLLGTS